MTTGYLDIAAHIDAGGSAESLVLALLDHVDVRPLALDALAGVRAIEWCDAIPTAAIEIGTAPRLLLSRTFVRAYCDTLETLAVVLLHELAHVTLAHTRLVPRATVLHNVAFDAIINRLVAASLHRRGVEAAPYLRLFERIYAANEAPWFLLRPPPQWPDTPEWNASAGAPEALRAVHRRLWHAPGRRRVDDTLPDVTVRELLDALGEAWRVGRAVPGAGTDDEAACLSSVPVDGRTSLDDVCTADACDDAVSNGERDAALLGRLLGNHGATVRERAILSGGDERRVLASPLGRAAPDAALLGPWAGVGSGRGLHEVRLERAPIDPALMRAFTRILSHAALDGGTRRRRVPQEVATLSPLADRDRRAWGRRHLARRLGAPAPVLFARSVGDHRPAPVRVSVYLDVSASMSEELAALHAVLQAQRGWIDVRVWQWSTVVQAAPAGWWRGREVRTTGGTDVECILRHAVARARRTQRVVVVTDGAFPSPAQAVAAALRDSGVQVQMVLMGREQPFYEDGREWVAREWQLRH